MNFPTVQQVEERIAFLKANPEKRPQSNTYCRSCMLAGIIHCSEVQYCGEMVSYDEVEK